MKRYDVAVAGAGVIGGFIAWNLAKAGLKVALVDPSGPAAKPSASWASAGGLRSQGRHTPDQPLAILAAERWRTMEEALDADLEISFGGHLHIAEREAECAEIERRLAADTAGGIAIERVEAPAIREIAPEITSRALLGAYTPGDGQAHPGRVARALARACAALGVATRFGAPARPIFRDGRVEGLTLEDGTVIEAGTTVIAAGAWSNALLGPLGIDLPVRPRGLQMLVSDVAPQDLLAPTVTAVGRNLSLKQLRSGAFMMGGRWIARPTGCGLETEPLDAQVSLQWSGAVAILPRLASHRLAHQWSGTEAQAIDGLPFIGRAGLPGLYLAFGFSNHGFQISPAVGELVAHDIVAGTEPLLAGFDPARAAQVAPADLAAFRDDPILDAPPAVRRYDRLLKPIKIGKLTIRNRVCLTGHGTGMPTDGTPNDQLIDYYEARAKGEVGLIMLGSQQVHPTSPGITGLLCNYDDRIIPGLARLAERVQRHGTRVFGYLSHMGFASSARPVALWSASPDFEEKYGEVAHAMTEAEIAEIVTAHADAAERCIRAGLDGIEVHCGHGLLVQQFLSPLSNHRTDRYGGSLKNRARFAEEILAAVRARIGTDVPLGIRCSGDELVPGGLTIEDMEEVVPWLVEAGALDFVDVSAGTDGNLVSNMLHEPPMGLPPGPFRSLARRIKARIDVPVIHATRIHTADYAEEMLADGDADLAGMVRPLIADPELPKKARLGKADEIIPCIGCEQACFGRLYRGRHISCIGNPATGREATHAQPARVPAAKILVVGGGPGGLEAARIAAERGHAVHLWERSGTLGGRLALASRPVGRSEWTRLLAQKTAELTRLGVEISLGRTADVNAIRGLAPDKVILATGARPRPYDLPGAAPGTILSLDEAVAAWDAGETRLGRRILIVDQLNRAPAIAAALGFARSGHETTIATSAFHVGQHLEIQNITYFYREALAAGVRFVPTVQPRRVENGQVIFHNVFTRLDSTGGVFDTIVAAVPGLPDTALADALAETGIPSSVIGDAYAPRDAEAAFLEGYGAGLAA